MFLNKKTNIYNVFKVLYYIVELLFIITAIYYGVGLNCAT